MNKRTPIRPITPNRLAQWLDSIGLWFGDAEDGPLRWEPEVGDHLSPNQFDAVDLRDLLEHCGLMAVRIAELESELRECEEDLRDEYPVSPAQEAALAKLAAETQQREEKAMRLLASEAGPSRANCMRCGAMTRHMETKPIYQEFESDGFFYIAPMFFWCDACAPKAWPAQPLQGWSFKTGDPIKLQVHVPSDYDVHVHREQDPEEP